MKVLEADLQGFYKGSTAMGFFGQGWCLMADFPSLTLLQGYAFIEFKEESVAKIVASTMNKIPPRFRLSTA